MDDRRLFRGKRLDNGEWVQGEPHTWGYAEFIRASAFGIEYRKSNIAETGLYTISTIAYCIDPATIGQCTGLTAAKSYRGDSDDDRLIWEGDRLKGGDGEFTVLWDCEKSAFVMRFWSDFDEVEELYMEGMLDDAEIIGTIHDEEGHQCTTQPL